MVCSIPEIRYSVYTDEQAVLVSEQTFFIPEIKGVRRIVKKVLKQLFRH